MERLEFQSCLDQLNLPRTSSFLNSVIVRSKRLRKKIEESFPITFMDLSQWISDVEQEADFNEQEYQSSKEEMKDDVGILSKEMLDFSVRFHSSFVAPSALL
jgi:hypothetical protein